MAGLRKLAMTLLIILVHQLDLTRMAEEDIHGSLAHVKMLKATNILSENDADQIISGLEKLEQKLHQGKLKFSVDNASIFI